MLEFKIIEELKPNPKLLELNGNLLNIEKGDTARISNMAYITPFLSLVWTSVILKEKLNIFSIIGLLIMIIGIFIQMKNNERNSKNV